MKIDWRQHWTPKQIVIVVCAGVLAGPVAWGLASFVQTMAGWWL